MKVEFSIDTVDFQGPFVIVHGAVNEGEVAIGTCFTSVMPRPVYSREGISIAVGESRQIALLTSRIITYRFDVDFLSCSMSGSLYLVGQGIDLLFSRSVISGIQKPDEIKVCNV